MYQLGTRNGCLGPCVSATTVWVFLLSFLCHSCHSCTVFFCHAYWVMFFFYGVRHAWVYGFALPFFVPPWNRHCPDKGFCPYSPLGSCSYHFSSIPWACWLCQPIGLITFFLGLPRPTYLIFTSYSSHGPAGCSSCHVGLLCLLSLFLGFLGSLTSSLPLILPMDFPFSFSFHFPYCWASSTIRPFIKNRHQQWQKNNFSCGFKLELVTT